LPGRFGIGELGEEAYRFVDFLVSTSQSLWQVLPLGPIGPGNSPYASPSAFAGNPLLISLEKLVEDGTLSPSDLEVMPSFPTKRVDYKAVIGFKMPLLKRAFENFKAGTSPELEKEFKTFCNHHSAWLDDYALFMAIEEAHHGAPWSEWESPLARREPEALRLWRDKLADAVLFHKFQQFLFFRQWIALKAYANERGIRIIGDVPIFVAHESADVWANPELFQLDEHGRPKVVAGVPPDYFSPTGQLWGNPLYRWDALSRRGYAWWIERLRVTLELVDIIRLDHFRGFEAYWEVPAWEETAINGRWVKGPGADFFITVEGVLGELPIIAEDLGFITPEVEELREMFGFPGMRVLQFAFGSDASNPHLPHNYPRNCVVYTGTHDNDTTIGWFRSAPEGVQASVLRYTGTDGSEINWDLIRLAFSSVADLAIIPLQDVFGLGREGRMNTPGKARGNWEWRYLPWAITDGIEAKLAEMTHTYGRSSSTGASYAI
jgi:4-alpha-glucanotransferase